MQNILDKKNVQGNQNGERDTDQTQSDQYNTLKVRGILEMDSKEIQKENYYSKIGEKQRPSNAIEPTQQPLLHENNLNTTEIETLMSEHRWRDEEKSFKKIIKRKEGDSSSSSDDEEPDKL